MTKPPKRRIKWRRSDDGFTTSKCGRYRIRALYCGCVRPQGYILACSTCKRDLDGGYSISQDEMKGAADDHERTHHSREQ